MTKHFIVLIEKKQEKEIQIQLMTCPVELGNYQLEYFNRVQQLFPIVLGLGFARTVQLK